MDQKYIYHFFNGFADGDHKMAEVLGGKGANLARMSKMGLPVPPGFTISCDVCDLYLKNDMSMPHYVCDKVKTAVLELESRTKKCFGGLTNPLLVSVRSGSKFSMPGMLDTVLNIGLNDEILKSNKNRFMLDSYRRLIQMYGNVVLKIDSYRFEECIADCKKSFKIQSDSDFQDHHLEKIIEKFKDIVQKFSGSQFPQDVYDQLFCSINAVFDSWGNERAKTYRKINDIPDSIGTAVNVQSMVFGNFNEESASGVFFTRNPSDGSKEIFGEYIKNAQGEDVVSGVRTPKDIAFISQDFPDLCQKIKDLAKLLEEECCDMQDIEFTIENGQLYVLQTRNGKRSAKAAIKIVVDLVLEGKISKKSAILKINPESLESLLHPTICKEQEENQIVARGLPASPGAGCGLAVFCTEEAVKRAQKGEKIVLIKSETSPEDIAGMNLAVAVVTTRGGMTSHAAVVARGMGKPCICALSGAFIDQENQELLICENKHFDKIKKNDLVTVDGAKGRLIFGRAETSQCDFFEEFKIFMQWVDDTKKIKVRANAETKEDILVAKKFGADGIGLCRTEHMFFSEDRINIVRKMIISEEAEGRRAELLKLLPIQTEDFKKIFDLMGKSPTTIRLLDPPLHEFLPLDKDGLESFKKYSGFSDYFIERRIKALKEENPMLGHRGCRLGISYPEIYQMQANAIFEAAKLSGYDSPEIMIPFVLNKTELSIIKKLVDEVASRYEISYSFGSMIELPSAALLCGQIAECADFLSFGTNDLTQTTLAISRDDCGKFLSKYQESGIFESDPFIRIVEDSVGKLVADAILDAKTANKSIKTGVCGEHGADPKSVDFFAKNKVDYVSCSAYRVPIAKLAAARAFLVTTAV